VRRIKILLCFHIKYLAAGLCEFCHSNKICESQGEDSFCCCVFIQENLSAGLCEFHNFEGEKNEAVGSFLYKKILSAGCEFLSQLEQKFKSNEMRRMRPLDGFSTRSSVCRM